MIEEMEIRRTTAIRPSPNGKRGRVHGLEGFDRELRLVLCNVCSMLREEKKEGRVLTEEEVSIAVEARRHGNPFQDIRSKALNNVGKINLYTRYNGVEGGKKDNEKIVRRIRNRRARKWLKKKKNNRKGPKRNELEKVESDNVKEVTLSGSVLDKRFKAGPRNVNSERKNKLFYANVRVKGVLSLIHI